MSDSCSKRDIPLWQNPVSYQMFRGDLFYLDLTKTSFLGFSTKIQQ